MKKLLITIFFFLLATPAYGAYYVNDPTSCLSLDPTNYPGQDCTPDNICGVVSGIVQCLDNSTLNPPTASSTSNTLYSGSYGGGFIMDCYRANSCNYGYCNRSSTCYTTKRRDTTCVPNFWEVSACGDCRSGYLDCAGDDVCEVQVGVTAWSTPNTTYLTCSTGQCSSGYMACEGETATVDGCNYQTGVTSCTTGGGEPGTWESGCVCTALPQENFITNTLASAWGNFLLYAEQLNPFGWLVNLYNSSTGAFFRVDYDGNVSTTGYISGGLNSVFGSTAEYLTVSTRDFVGGDNFVAPLLSFTNSNLIGQDTRIGAIDFGLFLSDIQDGLPTLGFIGSGATEPYLTIQYSTATQALTLNPDVASTSQEYFIFSKGVVNDLSVPLITGVAVDESMHALAVKESLILTGDSPFIGFYDEDDDSYNVLQMSSDGLLSLGGLSATRSISSTDTGLKEVLSANGSAPTRSPAQDKSCLVFKDSVNDSGLAFVSKTGAVCGINSEIGLDDWVGGLTFETFSTSTGSTTPITTMFITPTVITAYTDLIVSSSATSTFTGHLEIDGNLTINSVSTSCGTLGTDANGAVVCNDLGGMFGNSDVAELEARIAELEKLIKKQESIIDKIINFLKIWTKN